MKLVPLTPREIEDLEFERRSRARALSYRREVKTSQRTDKDGWMPWHRKEKCGWACLVGPEVALQGGLETQRRRLTRRHRWIPA